MMVSESMDRQLPLHRRILVMAHLMMCKYCHRFKKQLLILRNAVALEDIDDKKLGHSASLSKDARDRIKQAMRDLSPNPDPDSLHT